MYASDGFADTKLCTHENSVGPIRRMGHEICFRCCKVDPFGPPISNPGLFRTLFNYILEKLSK